MTTALLELSEQALQAFEAPSPRLHQEIDDKIQAFLDANPAQKVSQGLYICPGPIAVTVESPTKVKVWGRFLYPPDANDGHVEFNGEATGLALAEALPWTVGVATLYVRADVLEGPVHFWIHAGGVGPGGVQMTFKRDGREVGGFGAGAAIEGLIIADGSGSFKRV